MSLEPAVTSWYALKSFIHDNDLSAAAEELVRELINFDAEADEIKSAFANDRYILAALKEWVDDVQIDEDGDYDDDDSDWEYDDE